MKWLFVGDVHATAQELPDCQKLVDLILEKTDGGTAVVFLGDQYHTHATLRIEVIDFWTKALKEIKKRSLNVVLVVGNHDMPNDSSQSVHSMLANNTDDMVVVDHSTEWCGVGFMPYCHNPEEFVHDANKLGTKTLVCHQTFNGATYENGFYAKDGVEPDSLTATHIISGHIHTPAQFSKVTYVGAPRWRTASDANIDRFLHLYEDDDNHGGTLKLVEKIPTGTHCRKILQATINEDGTTEGRTDALDGDILHVDVRGSKAFCDEQKVKLASSGVRVRTFPKAEKSIKVRESEGIDKSFAKYLEAYCKDAKGFDPVAVKTMVADMVQNVGTSA
jgi:predicted phosphodiesterase